MGNPTYQNQFVHRFRIGVPGTTFFSDVGFPLRISNLTGKVIIKEVSFYPVLRSGAGIQTFFDYRMFFSLCDEKGAIIRTNVGDIVTGAPVGNIDSLLEIAFYKFSLDQINIKTIPAQLPCNGIYFLSLNAIADSDLDATQFEISVIYEMIPEYE